MYVYRNNKSVSEGDRSNSLNGYIQTLFALWTLSKSRNADIIITESYSTAWIYCFTKVGISLHKRWPSWLKGCYVKNINFETSLRL